MAGVDAARAGGRQRQPQLLQELSLLKRRLVGPQPELFDRQLALAACAGDDGHGLVGEERRRRVRRGRRVADVAAHGRHVHRLEGADDLGAVGEGAVSLSDRRRFRDLGHGDAGADAQAGPLVEVDAAELGDATEADQVGRGRYLVALLDLHDEVGAAGEGAAPGAPLAKEGERVSQALRGVILERSQGALLPWCTQF